MKNKKRFTFLPLILILSMIALRPAPTTAATTAVTGGTNGPLCNSGGYFTPASVTVTSGDTVTFSVPANDPYAGGVQVNGFPQGSFVVPRGGSVTTQALNANVSYQGTWPNAPSCIKGSGTVTVQAPSSPPPSSPPPSSSGTSTPSPSPSSSSTSTPKSTTKSTTTPVTPTPSASSTQPTAAPETVVADTITVAGKKVTSTQNLTINQSQPMVLSGTTVPNGKVTLTIHSNPTTTTVQADSSGNWSYTVTGLPPGNHLIEASVTDPATNQTSAPSRLLSFTIKAAPVTSATASRPVQTKKSSLLLVAIAGAIILLVVLGVVMSIMKKKKRKSTAIASTEPPALVTPPVVQQNPPSDLRTPSIGTEAQGGTSSVLTPNTDNTEESHHQDNE